MAKRANRALPFETANGVFDGVLGKNNMDAFVLAGALDRNDTNTVTKKLLRAQFERLAETILWAVEDGDVTTAQVFVFCFLRSEMEKRGQDTTPSIEALAQRYPAALNVFA